MFGIGYWGSLVLVIAIMAVVGYVGQRGLFNFTLGEDPLPGILASFGVGIVIQNALQQHYTATDRTIDLGPILTKSITINDDISIGWFPLLTLVVAVVVLLALQLLFSRTSIGRAFRATADDPQTAQLMGINDRRLYGVAMAIAFAAVALAGFFRGARTSFSPTAGAGILLFAFEAVVIGGLGSLWGTLVGGIVLGLAQSLGNQASIGWDLLSGHLVFLFVLLSARGAWSEGRGHDLPGRPDHAGLDRRRVAGHRGDGVLRPLPAVGEHEHAADPGPDLLLPVAGADVEPPRGLRRAGHGGPAGLRRRRRLHPLRAERAAQRRPVRRHRHRRSARGRRSRSPSPCSPSGCRVATSPSAPG